MKYSKIIDNNLMPYSDWRVQLKSKNHFLRTSSILWNFFKIWAKMLIMGNVVGIMKFCLLVFQIATIAISRWKKMSKSWSKRLSRWGWSSFKIIRILRRWKKSYAKWKMLWKLDCSTMTSWRKRLIPKWKVFIKLRKTKDQEWSQSQFWIKV